MAPPGHNRPDGFADNPDTDRVGSEEAEISDRLRRQYYDSRKDFYTTESHKDPVQEAVIRNMLNGFRKMKIITTDEHHLSTTVFINEDAALTLIDFLADNMVIRSTRSGQGWRASLKEQTPAAAVSKQIRYEGFTENTTN